MRMQPITATLLSVGLDNLMYLSTETHARGEERKHASLTHVYVMLVRTRLGRRNKDGRNVGHIQRDQGRVLFGV